MPVTTLPEWLRGQGARTAVPEVVPEVVPDVIIVGAGAVGLAMAVDLARRGRQVLVLEGGPPDPPADWQACNRGRNAGREHLGLREGRMQAYGGTTRLWGGQLVPFDPADFAAEPHLGKPGWPIAYQDFAGWVGRAYDLLGVPSPARDTSGLWSRVTGMDSPLGGDIVIGMNIWLRQPDFTRLFAADIAGHANLQVVCGARLRRLRFGEEGRVSELAVAGADGGEVTIAARQVILAMGTLEISRQLLATAATEPLCGFADNAHLGRWYLDHVHGLCGRVKAANTAILSRVFDNIYAGKQKFNVKMRASAGLRQRAMIGNVAATLNTRAGLRAMASDFLGLAKRIFAGDGRSIGAVVRQGVVLAGILLPLAWRYVVRRRASSLVGDDIWLGMELEQLPSKDSYVSLDPAFPPGEAPLVLHWHLGEREMLSARTMAEAVARAFAEAGYGTLEIDPDLAAGRLEWLDSCHDSNHQMGGARMAAAASDGVVDRDCRVFGTSNLHVAGAAVFPSGSFANPTLSAIALGLRLADHIDDQVRGVRDVA